MGFGGLRGPLWAPGGVSMALGVSVVSGGLPGPPGMGMGGVCVEHRGLSGLLGEGGRLGGIWGICGDTKAPRGFPGVPGGPWGSLGSEGGGCGGSLRYFGVSAVFGGSLCFWGGIGGGWGSAVIGGPTVGLGGLIWPVGGGSGLLWGSCWGPSGSKWTSMVRGDSQRGWGGHPCGVWGSLDGPMGVSVGFGGPWGWGWLLTVFGGLLCDLWGCSVRCWGSSLWYLGKGGPLWCWGSSRGLCVIWGSQGPLCAT